MLAAIAVAATACSSLPPPVRPPHHDHRVEAEFIVPANGRLALPTSSATLVLQQLELAPPPLREHVDQTSRWFAYAPGTRVTVHARFRSYASGDDAPPGPAAVLPGAATLRVLDAP